ncbi:AzlC family ABC transporter permease [Oceanobacter mangrovi]|uniref:AzlC family ABC transporter permease n=1 Tax=Oceanobacter mangrovi TaxID=2862510 RepID=UPI001C8EC815|nr:AzlC family ABC transporter permease [Oceanobacter mangrovi]
MTTLNSQAFKASLPVMFGYVPLGIAFGILFAGLGYHWLFASLYGLVVYAGAAQFLAVGLLSAQAGLLEVAVATLLLNARHMFYGLSLIGKLGQSRLARFYQIFGLTDETYSLVSAAKIPAGVDAAAWRLRITAFNQTWWVIGCSIGGWLGSRIEFSTAGIEFALPALFVVLLVEQYRYLRALWPFVTALLVGLFTLFVISRDQMLLISVMLALCVLLLQWRTGWPSSAKARQTGAS